MTTLFDASAPEATECRVCHAFVHRYLATIKGRTLWCWPGGDDGETCRECWDRGVAKRERIRCDLAQAAAGIPPKYRGPSIRNGHAVVQHKDEADHTTKARDDRDIPVTNAGFIARVKAGNETDPRCWGVSRLDGTVMRALKAWHPDQGSIFLEGKPGTGKSMVACVLANDLVSKPTTYVCMCDGCRRRWEDGDLTPEVDGEVGPWLGVDQHEHRGPKPARLRIDGAREVRFVKEGRLIGSLQKPKEEGQHIVKDDEFGLAVKCSILVFDDLGTEESMQEWHKDRLFRMVDDRYTAIKRPTIFTSNLPLSDLSLRYGERFASRVREMVGPRRYEFRTQWRTT